ncbi:MAG: succinate dehydrogenase assembly factor 2 [Methylobacter sp.]
MNELARLKWQCRRGTKELDLMLKKYLETGYLLADDEEKALFVELLKLEDDELTGVLMGDRKPDAKELAGLIYKIAK